MHYKNKNGLIVRPNCIFLQLVFYYQTVLFTPQHLILKDILPDNILNIYHIPPSRNYSEVVR